MESISLSDIMREYKTRYQYTNKELAEVFQVSTNTVNRWLRGEIQTIQGDTAERVSDILGYNVLAVLRGQIVDLKKPVVSMRRAGYELFVVQDHLGDAIVSSEEYKAGDYFIKVDNNDMCDVGIVNGTLVYVKKVNRVNPEDIAVVVINDIAYLRYVKKAEGFITLSAANAKVDDMVYSNVQAKREHLTIIGKVLFSKNVY
ncbi:MAG: helix-turn-helix domain-containing protein [Erysipelotrichaceae bacterium]|nr:helix-turn-helix domain-containing protein [Erysipelotrichaceae bacterium]